MFRNEPPSTHGIYFLSLFIYFGKEREKKRVYEPGRGREREREKDRERATNRLQVVSAEPDVGLDLMNRKIIPEPKSRVRHLTN